jgi:hypothetical protein
MLGVALITGITFEVLLTDRAGAFGEGRHRSSQWGAAPHVPHG